MSKRLDKRVAIVFGAGSVGLQNRALGAHGDVVVMTPPLQGVPMHEPVRTIGPIAPVRRD